MSRKPAPYGTCSNTKPTEYLYPLTYDSEACHRSMAQKDFVTKCGCYDPSYPKPTYSSVGFCVIPDNRKQRRGKFWVHKSDLRLKSSNFCSIRLKGGGV